MTYNPRTAQVRVDWRVEAFNIAVVWACTLLDRVGMLGCHNVEALGPARHVELERRPAVLIGRQRNRTTGRFMSTRRATA